MLRTLCLIKFAKEKSLHVTKKYFSSLTPGEIPVVNLTFGLLAENIKV